MKRIALLLLTAALFATTACQKEFESSGVTAVILSEEVLYLISGHTANLTATVEPANVSQDVVWTTSDASIATVSQSGEVSAISAGVAYISATSKIGKRVGTCTVFVDPIPVTGVTVRSTLDMLVHEVVTLEPVITPDDAADTFVKWESSDEKVATVSVLGEVKALYPGTAVITVITRDGGFEAKCTVTVTKIPVTGVVLNETAFEGIYGATLQLEANVSPDNASFPQLTWTTSDEDIVTVSETGLIKIVSKEAGSAVIRVTSNDNETIWDECVVTVFKDMSEFVETVLWEGEQELFWNAPGQIGIAYSHFEDLPVESILIIHFQQTEAWGQAQINDGDWTQLSIPEIGGGGTITTNTYDDKSVTKQEIVLTQALLDHIHANHGNFGGLDCGIIIQGENWILTKVIIAQRNISDEPVIEFTLPENGEWGWQYLYESDTWYGDKVEEGDEFTFTYKFKSDVAMDRLQVFIVDNSAGGWTVLSGYVSIQSPIEADTEYEGTATITANASASSGAVAANKVGFSSGTGTESEPTLTFTVFKLEKE